MAVFGEVAMMVYNLTLNCSYNDLLLTNDTNCTYPENNEDTFNFFTPPEWLIQFARVSYGLVGVLGLGGNTLVIYVVLRFSKMQTVTNMYILNLAFADEMYLIGLPFLLTTMIFHSWPFGRVMCKIYMTTTSINQFTSSLLLTVMSADRYVAVCHPIQSPRYRTPFIAKFICLTAWTLSALLMVPIYMYASTLDTGMYINCNIYWPESSYMNGEMAFTLYAFTLGFALPLVLILLFYFLVICKLRNVGPKTKAKRRNVLTEGYLSCPLCHHSVHHLLVTILVCSNVAHIHAAGFRREVNAQLHVENSFFPKTKSGSSRQAEKKSESSKNPKTSGRSREPEQSTAVTVMKNEKDASSALKNGFNKQLDSVAVTQV
ncbi:somatostatin receptor type 5 [Trichonephila inaurata madagascariensis]|uniref:Somatostatin receptor type 5 n=1 Tax=Trichonephila inaurata madagascariensis TaxID=2747483 RepID=A0A8X6KDG1_9ARAC|nr:somatostatin receptor type 5 [Trichonephila inaurata madagascariensis]